MDETQPSASLETPNAPNPDGLKSPEKKRTNKGVSIWFKAVDRLIEAHTEEFHGYILQGKEKEGKQ